MVPSALTDIVSKTKTINSGDGISSSSTGSREHTSASNEERREEAGEVISKNQPAGEVISKNQPAGEVISKNQPEVVRNSSSFSSLQQSSSSDDDGGEDHGEEIPKNGELSKSSVQVRVTQEIKA